MIARRWLLVGGAAAAAVATMKLACSEAKDAAPGSAGASAASGSAGTGMGGTGGAAATGGTGGSAGAPVYDGGVWQPTGDPGWTKVPWLDCPAMYARRPEHAVPPLVWEACEGVPGCERLVVNWEYDFPPLRTLHLSGGGVYDTPSGMVFVLLINTKWNGFITAAFSEAKTPIAAWRSPDDGCVPWHFEWSSKHVCLTFGGLPPLSVGLVPPDEPNGTPLKTFQSVPDVPIACNDNLLFAMDTGNRKWVRDLETDAVHQIGWSTGVAYFPRVHGDLALVPRKASTAAGDDILEGWLWQRPNSLTKLVDVTPDLVFDIRTDGTTLAWLRAASKKVQWSPADVWVSPFTADPAKLQPKKLGSVPSATIASDFAAIGGGYYAVIEPKVTQANAQPDSPDSELHVFRLSDGTHWLVPRIPDASPSTQKPDWSPTIPSVILELSSTEVWWEGMSQYSHTEWTIVRQRLDALGPGD